MAGVGDHTIADKMTDAHVQGLHRIEFCDERGQPCDAALEIRYQQICLLPPIGRQKLSTALAAGSQAAEALVARATVAVGDDDEALAGTLLARAQALLPNDGRILAAVGLARMAQGNFASAEQALQRSVALMTHHVGTWHALAWCQMAAGKLDAAALAFEEALALDRNFGESHGGLAVIEAARGEVQRARDGIERARRLDARGMAYRYAEALLAGQAQDPAELRGLAQRLLRQRSATAALRLVDRLGH